jgi:hypothetical protein
MGIVTLSVRIRESRYGSGTIPIANLPATVNVILAKDGNSPPVRTQDHKYSGNIVGAGDYLVDTLGANFIILVETRSLRNPLKTAKAGFYTMYDLFGNKYQTGKSYLIELWYSWERDSWEITTAPGIINDNAVFGVPPAPAYNPAYDWSFGLSKIQLPKFPDVGKGISDVIMWVVIGIAAFILIILVVMRG